MNLAPIKMEAGYSTMMIIAGLLNEIQMLKEQMSKMQKNNTRMLDRSRTFNLSFGRLDKGTTLPAIRETERLFMLKQPGSGDILCVSGQKEDGSWVFKQVIPFGMGSRP